MAKLDISKTKDFVLESIKDKETIMETLTDETLEPHVHLTILLVIVFIIAIVLTFVTT